MSKLTRKGSPERFKELVKQKIEDLSSCSNPSGTEVEGGIDIDDMNSDEAIAARNTYDTRYEEATEGYQARGYDLNDDNVKMMIATTAEYLSNAPEDYTIDDWFEDTKQNYPNMLDPDNYDNDTIAGGCNTTNFGDESDITSENDIETDTPETVEAADDDFEDETDDFEDEDIETDVDDDYVWELGDQLQYTEIPGLSEVIDTVDIDTDEDTLFISVTFVDDNGEISINDYEVPYSDLSGVKEDDIDYVCDEIEADLEDYE